MARFCEQCGQQLKQGARFCASCGTAVEGAAAPPAAGLEDGPESGSPPAVEEERDVRVVQPLGVQSIGELLLAILTVGIAWLVFLVRRARTRYRVTTQRIEVRSGILNVTRRSVDLYRIQDFEVREPLFLRLRGAGDLVVRAMDPGEPELVMKALPDANGIHEELRRLCHAERVRHRVRLIE